MSWRTEWQAIASKIQGLLGAGEFFVQFQHPDDYAITEKELIPLANSILDDIIQYTAPYKGSLSPMALHSLKQFIERNKAYFEISNKFQKTKALLTYLAAFHTEFSFLLSDIQMISRRITERAFVHLQRSISADPDIGERWRKAFKAGEVHCE